jgi:hypothetical protein
MQCSKLNHPDTPPVTERLNFEEAIATLRGWLGQDVTVSLAPLGRLGTSSGVVWGKLGGALRESDRGHQWEPDRPPEETTAFQVGEHEENYFVVYRGRFEAGWLERDAGLLLVTMRPAFQIMVAISRY